MSKANTRATAPAMSTYARYLAATARAIPSSMNANVVKCLFEGRVRTEADLAVVDTFLKAAAAVQALPTYKAMINELEAKKHCVRCHDTFSDADNESGDCVIPHVFNCDEYQRTYMGLEYPSECCGEAVTLEEEGAGNNDWTNLDDLDMCYEGTHTTNLRVVQSEYNDTNILPCKMENGKCVRGVIDDDGDSPVWTWKVNSD
ncbi:hypothetical protein Hypma_010178 [Hypsizygus marmoreus]|uniref:Uncharacterized protein n=1 Tax=Hypsizygus marmoreus TaxID=39966 RepID=A0A369JKW4_HYPMA|nr:hypothetical protein Hypma_010178 [Hypsizygus marmoreus]